MAHAALLLAELRLGLPLLSGLRYAGKALPREAEEGQDRGPRGGGGEDVAEGHTGASLGVAQVYVSGVTGEATRE